MHFSVERSLLFIAEMRSSFGRSWILYSPPLINPNTLDLNSQPYDHVDDVSPPIGELQMATLVILASLGPCHVERFQVRSFLEGYGRYFTG